MGLSATIPQAAPAAEQYPVEIKVSGLRSTKGFVLVCLTMNAKAFPDCGKDAGATRLKVAAAQAGSIKASVAQPGTYAVSVLHDENGNQKADFMLGMPREGFGFSRDAKVRFGPPKFAAASFVVGAGGTAQSITMKYLL